MRARISCSLFPAANQRFLQLTLAWLIVLSGFTPVVTESAAAKQLPQADHIIYPTGEFPTDVQNVQVAADQGGSILLKATNLEGVPTAFNFGSPDDFTADRGVFLTKDVQISGEQHAPHWTTIDGGAVPFRGFGPAIRTSITAIDFEQPLLSAVIITASTGSVVSGNRIINVQGFSETFCEDPPDCAITFTFTEGRAIKFLGNDDPEYAIVGKVVVSDNEIRDSHADLSSAIVFDEVAADTTIEGNRIVTTQENGILMINSGGHVTIDDNTISPGPGDASPFSAGNGIFVQDTEQRGAAYTIANNTLDIENQNADGIILYGVVYGSSTGLISGAVVRGNHVTMHDTYYGGITMIDNVSNSLVAHNTIRGSASFGIDVLRFDPASDAGSNTSLGNNLATFNAAVADLVLDSNTHDTVVVGHTGTVIDLGTNNHVTGRTPIGSASIGHQIAQAQAAHERLFTEGATGQ